MNERIEKLAEQAVLQANEVFDQKGKDYSGIVMEKFAELIVRECQTVVEWAISVDSTIDRVPVLIQEHFGVRE
jgi:hypothetical protein